jgi:hypothetical protein
VESSCESGIEPSRSVKAGKVSSVLTTRDLSSSAQLHGVSYFKEISSHSPNECNSPRHFSLVLCLFVNFC